MDDLLPTSKDERIMYLLGEIRSDTKAINAHLSQLNSKVATQEKRLDEHDRYTARQEGEMKAAGKVAGAVWGIGSASAVTFILQWLLKK